LGFTVIVSVPVLRSVFSVVGAIIGVPTGQVPIGGAPSLRLAWRSKLRVEVHGLAQTDPLGDLLAVGVHLDLAPVIARDQRVRERSQDEDDHHDQDDLEASECEGHGNGQAAPPVGCIAL
jgi:hypothetical protein